MCRDRREVRHKVGDVDGDSQGFGHRAEHARLEVRRPVLAVGPEGKYATAPTVVVVQIGIKEP